MTFKELISLIKKTSKVNDFVDATKKVIEYINELSDVTNLLYDIGAIPESLVHDSTEERLFSKASDAVLARAFSQLGLKTTVLTERADSADIIAESVIHGYTLVADAKAFRLSRTAENQIVLDPFAGSGTTCLAAKLLNRKYIGIEINKDYFEIANNRINMFNNNCQDALDKDSDLIKSQISFL